MCFSPEVSFSSAIFLALTSVYALSLVKSPRQLPLACLPLFFGLHQACEGVLWLYLRDHAVSTQLALIAQRGYVFFAYLFFPVYFPFIAWNWEQSPSRRFWIMLFLLIGLSIACLHTYRLVGDEIIVKQVGSSIQYPAANSVISLMYLCATCASLLFCHDRKIWSIGILGIVSFFFCWLIFYLTAASVWCFCAAWISILSVWVLHQPFFDETHSQGV